MTILAPADRAFTGSLRFIRYGFMPNRLRYCGPDDNRTLFDYAVARTVDPGLTPLLRQFSGAMPYLTLIARANGIADPFDERVVEAYWVGNDLLDAVEVRQLYDHLAERFGGQLRGRARAWVLGKAPAGARPHHSFHVLDVYRVVGDRGDSLETMDSCRVSWGRVTGVEGPFLRVQRQPVALVAGKLSLLPAVDVRVARQVDGRGFADAADVGDWVSIHWGWACERLRDDQRAALARYTAHHLAIANQTI